MHHEAAHGEVQTDLGPEIRPLDPVTKSVLTNSCIIAGRGCNAGFSDFDDYHRRGVSAEGTTESVSSFPAEDPPKGALR
jgi:hypothetical protein